MKVSTKLWYGLAESVACAGAAAVMGTALVPAAFAGQRGEGGEGAKPAAHGKPASKGDDKGKIDGKAMKLLKGKSIAE